MSQKRGPKGSQARHVGQDFFALGGGKQNDFLHFFDNSKLYF